MAVKVKTVSKKKKAKRKRKPRRQLPETLDYISRGEIPNDLDVVSGRGGGSNNHLGNRRYWREILCQRPHYKILGTIKHDNNMKTKIAQDILDFIVSSKGRFLQKEKKTARWFKLPLKIAIDKIKQALRDEYIPSFANKSSFQSNLETTTPTLLLQNILMERPESIDSTIFQTASENNAMNASNNIFSTNSTDGLKPQIENLHTVNFDSFNRSFSFTSLSTNNKFASTDDLGQEIGKLSFLSNESISSSLGFLKGHSFDFKTVVSESRFELGSAVDTQPQSTKNAFTVSKKSSWLAKFEEEVVTPSYQVQTV
jgi:hypothetical protein